MSTIKSKVFRLLNPNDLVIQEELIDLKLLKDDEFFCETLFSAISPGTETAAYSGIEPLRVGKQYPRLVGYCNIGRVLEKGINVNDLSEGDIILTFQSHRSHFLQNSNSFYIKVNDKNFKKYTSAYLFHLGYHALITAKNFQGHNVGVIGAGVLGYTAAIMSKVSGSKTIVLTNQQKARTKLNDIDISTYKKDDNVIQNIFNETKSVGIDILINTSNSWSDWKFALKLINKGGVIVNIGFPGRGEPYPKFNPLDPKYIYTKNLTIKSLSYLNEKEVDPYEQRFNLKRNMKHIFRLIKENKISSNDIISKEINFRELEDQYKKYLSKKDHLLSTLLLWKN